MPGFSVVISAGVFRDEVKLHLFGDEVGLGFRELILQPSQLVGGQVSSPGAGRAGLRAYIRRALLRSWSLLRNS